MQVEINLGLTIKGEYTPETIDRFVHIMKNDLITYRKDIGLWESIEEPILVCILDLEPGNITNYVEQLCIATEQTCIPVKYRFPNKQPYGKLVYNPYNHNCKKEMFNEKYFISFTNCEKLPDCIGYSMSKQN